MSFNFKSFASNAQHFLSERIALRPLTLSDAWPLWDATQTPAFNHHLLWEQPKGPEEIIARVRQMLDETTDNLLSAVSAVSRSTGEWIGLLRLYEESPGTPSPGIETGIWTHPRFWRGGFSEEYARLVRDAAFDTSDVQWLTARTAVNNKAGRALIEGVGLTVHGTEVVPCEIAGQVKEALNYRITREHWEAVRHQHPFTRY